MRPEVSISQQRPFFPGDVVLWDMVLSKLWCRKVPCKRQWTRRLTGGPSVGFPSGSRVRPSLGHPSTHCWFNYSALLLTEPPRLRGKTNSVPHATIMKVIAHLMCGHHCESVPNIGKPRECTESNEGIFIAKGSDSRISRCGSTKEKVLFLMAVFWIEISLKIMGGIEY